MHFTEGHHCFPGLRMLVLSRETLESDADHLLGELNVHANLMNIVQNAYEVNILMKLKLIHGV